ncbi:apical endosomal glycoprotein-like [Antedon mediterranea]|uniref:apical endosomal glycoprotein-like n=1 Tax=Antedon mediterranea TaxID=105859 RepID=UPI003AF79C67
MVIALVYPPSACDFVCNDGTDLCIPSDQVCDFVNDCANSADEVDCGHSCTFEVDECNWGQNSDSEFYWKRYRGATPTENTGPAYDHTLLSAAGWYMYVAAGNGDSSAYASLYTPIYHNSAASCEAHFWYHMKGNPIGTLRVYLDEQYYLLVPWEITGDQGDRWNLASAPLGRITGTFRVWIQAQRSFDTLGDIAIDDITFSRCGLPRKFANHIY